MARNRNWSFLEAVINGAFTVPGDGAVDFAVDASNALQRHGYRGWLVVEAEQDPSVAPSYRVRREGLSHTCATLVDARSEARGGSMSLLVKGRRDGRDIVRVTPESAGWTHVGFAAHRLAAGEVDATSR